MHPMGDQRQHYFLTLGMARVMGIDLTAALRDGLLSRQDYAEMIARCRACDDPPACAGWIAAQRLAAERADAPPAYCRNAGLLAELDRL